MLLARAASAAACSAVKGGASTISTPVTSFTSERNSFTYFTASATVLYIFQLPATIGVLMSHQPCSGNANATCGCPAPSMGTGHSDCSTLWQHSDARQRASSEEF